MSFLLIWKAAEINPQTLLGIWPYGNIWILYDGLVFWNICRSLASWAFYILLLIFFTTALKSKQTHLRDKVKAAEGSVGKSVRCARTETCTGSQQVL